MRRNFKHANAQASTQTGLYTEACTQKFFTQMRQMLLHTEAFEHRCLYTQKHLPRDALTYTRLYTQKLLDTDCSERITEALTLRSLYTENLLHTEGFTHTHKLFHRSFYTEKLLRTGAFTHRRLYTQKLVHTEAFAHKAFAQRSLYTDAFPQKNRFHRAAFTRFKKSQFNSSFSRSAIISCERVASGVGKSQILTLDNHFA